MSRLFLVLSALLSFQVVSGAQTLETYRSEVLKFEIGHPVGWRVDYDELIFISQVTRNQWMHGLGIPISPYSWVMINKLSKGVCGDIKVHEFQKENPGVPEGQKYTAIFDKVVCRDGFVIEIGYWDVRGRDREKKILEEMLASFKIVQ